VRFVATEWYPTDYADADVLITLRRAGFRLCDVPVRMYKRAGGRSMHAGLRPVYYVFKMLLSIALAPVRREVAERKGSCDGRADAASDRLRAGGLAGRPRLRAGAGAPPPAARGVLLALAVDRRRHGDPGRLVQAAARHHAPGGRRDPTEHAADGRRAVSVRDRRPLLHDHLPPHRAGEEPRPGARPALRDSRRHRWSDQRVSDGAGVRATWTSPVSAVAATRDNAAVAPA